jgi:hypothetical protein
MSTPQGDDTAQDLTEPAQDTAGSSASTDPEVADLESDLLGGQGGDDTATPDAEQPADTTTPDAEQPADTTTPDSGGEESSVSEVQKLTGQLTQKMREAGQQMQPTDFKSVINSVIAAMDMSQLSEEDTNDIIKKIKKQTNKGEDGEMNEYGEQYGYESDNVMYNNEPARFRASGGQTVGENTLNEKLELIIKRAKENVLREKK